MILPLAHTQRQQQLWDKLEPVIRVAASDTYKRTMSAAGTTFQRDAVYTLAARKPLKEEGANGRLISAGLEKTLYTFFRNPIAEEEIAEVEEFFTKEGAVNKFDRDSWDKVTANGGYMPVDVWMLPGGQTFLVKDGKHVPLASVEGPGTLVSCLEDHFTQNHDSIIYATKARLFRDALGAEEGKLLDRVAEFGLRSARNTNMHATLMLALYVGGGIHKTSDDHARMIFKELFTDSGTQGHEFLMAYQKEGRTLEEAQHLAMMDFINSNEFSAVLPDVIHTLGSGFPEIIHAKVNNPNKIIVPRPDSGDVDAYLVRWGELARAHGLTEEIILADGRGPQESRNAMQLYKRAGFDEYLIGFGSGGYFQDNATRDEISMAYKRAGTWFVDGFSAQIKLSDSVGKASIPGRTRVYGRGNTLIVAQADEKVDGGILLSQKVVENGRIIYNETIQQQFQRAEATWDLYTNIEYSPQTQAIIDSRQMEKDTIVSRLEGS